AEQPPPLRPVAHGHGQVAGPALAIVGALRVPTAEAAQVVIRPSVAHRAPPQAIGLVRREAPRLQHRGQACNTKGTPPSSVSKAKFDLPLASTGGNRLMRSLG